MSDGPRRVGVVVGPQRVTEGLRMASALALCDNEVDVVLTGESLADSDEIALHLDSLDLAEIPVSAAFDDPRVETMNWTALRRRLEECEHVITY